ncbi:MAG: cupin domain-containing protein [Opitutales bacterium]
MSATALLSASQAGICPLHALPRTVKHGIVSQAVLTVPGLRLTLMHFAAGQELSEHTSTARALVQVFAGSCDFSFEGQTRRLKAGDLLHLPPGLPHSVQAVENLTLLLTQVAPPPAGK